MRRKEERKKMGEGQLKKIVLEPALSEELILRKSPDPKNMTLRNGVFIKVSIRPNSHPIDPAMAWHKPNSLTGAMKSLRLTSTLSNTSIHSSRPTLNTLRTRNYATEAAPAAEPAAVAPEIDFGSFSQKPARIVPASRSYFSGSPRFIDAVLSLEALQAKYASLPTVTNAEAPRMAWFKLPQFRDFVGEAVPMKKYKSLLKILQRMNCIQPGLVPEEVRETLAKFLRPGNPYAAEEVPRTVDENGRARAKGKRKESTAVVQLVEGEGEVLVNGKSIAEVFKRIHDRESALHALRVTQRVDKYNAWIVVKGGGVTGQAEAITLALGRALLMHEPGLKPVLRKGMCLILRLMYLAFTNFFLSWCHYCRCSSCREKEAWSRQGSQDAYLGQALNGRRFLEYFPFLFQYCIIHQPWHPWTPGSCFISCTLNAYEAIHSKVYIEFTLMTVVSRAAGSLSKLKACMSLEYKSRGKF
jgi:small subunit ribosomal protein S9